MKKKLLIIIVALILIALGVWSFVRLLQPIDSNSDFTAESLRWTKIGAIGSWAGSLFAAVALIISICAFWLPQKVKIAVEIRTGMIISQLLEVDKIDVYTITVKNTGIKPVTITNIYLHFGDKKQGDIFVGMLNDDTLLQAFTPKFPQRLEQGEAFEYHLQKDKLDAALAHYEEKKVRDTPLSIRVDEVTIGSQYCKTKWTLGSFIGRQ